MFENQFCKIKNCHESVSEGKEYCEIHVFENMVNKSFSLDEETNERQLGEKEIRNILLIGYTGNGKSTLANVITGTNNFKESESGISETKEVQVEKFNLIIEETEKEINVTESHFNNYNNQLKKFISDREVIVKLVEERKEKLNEHMKSRFVFNTTGHAISLSGKSLLVAGIWFPPAFVPGAVLSIGSLLGVSSSEAFWITEEKNLYDLFEENLNKDKENREKLENLQTELKNSVGRFREIYDQFKDSEYKKQDIDKKKIEVVKKVIKKVLGEEIETSENPSEEKNHSTPWKAGRATLEALAKCAPFPNFLLGAYLAYRDYQEIENRTSLSDMEKVIENWKEELKVWKDKEEPLNEECKEIRDCQKEIEKLLLDNKLKREENTQSSSSQEQIFQIEQPPK